MKLLDFTGRKVDPSLMMGFKDNKKEQDPNVKVSVFNRLKLYIVFQDIQSLQTICISCFTHTKPNSKKGKGKTSGKKRSNLCKI